MARYPLLGRPNPISDVFITFCRENGFDFLEDLLPQFLRAFSDKGDDYEQIRGSVSVFDHKILKFRLRSLAILGCTIGDVLVHHPLSSGECTRHDK